jgi:RNA polymerase sigma-70 factor, ECF subfamily
MDEVVRLIEAEIPRLRRYARALLRDQDRADDLVQDTLVRGLDKMHLFRSGDIRAWLFTIMHNQYVNSVRRSVKQGMAIVVEKVPLASPPQQLPNLELHELENAIARLSKEQRETLLLVAQVCDVPIGTVRSRLNRAREELRRMTEGIIARQGSRPTPARREGAPFAVAPITDSKPAK